LGVRFAVLLTGAVALGFSSALRAGEYPVSGVWVDVTDPATNAATLCETYSKQPKSPVGHVVVFKGSRRIDYNGGYLVEEVVDNVAVRRDGPDRFTLTDRYYDDGEAGTRSGFRKRSYRLQVLGPDEIETKEGSYPSSRLVKCPSSSAPINSMLVEPDRPFGAVGDWKISTARYGVGCVAVYDYAPVRSISIGGQKPDQLELTVGSDRKLFTVNLDSEPYVEGVEFVLGDWRRGDLRPYGYRGTPGLVAAFDAPLARAFLEAPSLKLTERGAVKLTIPLNEAKRMMGELMACFRKTR
jgi:hypothetical protein